MGDILNLNWSYLNVPYGSPGGKGHGINNYLFFEVADPNLRTETLYVFLTDASEQHDARGMGQLQGCMLVPNVVFPPRSKIMITGLNTRGEKVQFNGIMKRGAHYILKESAAGHHNLPSYISTENCPCCPYNTSY